MGRAPCCDKANVKKGPWSPEEDAKLKSYMEAHGTGGNWITLPQKIGLRRCGKSCRLRWLNYLRPNIRHGSFTEDEDNMICSLFVSIGSRWSIIASQLPGRTDNDIKNYWNTKLKKKLLGKQRREQPPRQREKFATENSFSLHPKPEQAEAETEAALFPVGYTVLQQPPPNTLTNPQMEAKHFPDYTPAAIHSISELSCTQLHQQICKNSMSVLNGSWPESGIHIDLPDSSGIFTGMPQLLDGFDGFSAIDMVSSSSLKNTSWGDTSSSIAYSQSALTSFEIRKMFDEPRLLGYLQ